MARTAFTWRDEGARSAPREYAGALVIALVPVAHGGATSAMAPASKRQFPSDQYARFP